MVLRRALALTACRMAVGLVSLAAAASLSAQPQARDESRAVGGTATLAGVVINADEAAAPVRSATVTLTDLTGRIPTRTTDTDADGKFAFANLPGGRYEVAATKPAYLKGTYGAARPLRPGTPIAITDGQQLTALTVRMWRGGIITGLLLDEKNRPLSGITVMARRLQLVNGARIMAAATTGTATTDSRGFYRIFGLPPGDYAVLSTIAGPGRAGPSQPTPARQITPDDVQRALRNDPRTGGSRGAASPPPLAESFMGYAPVYYPGTTVSVDAMPVHVEAGEERGGIDFAALLVPLSVVSGTIAPPGGRTITELDVSVGLTARSEPSGLVVSRSIPVAADGTFTSGPMTPGVYTVMARATSQASGSSESSRAAGWWAAARITIDGRNVPGVHLTLEPGVTITGRVVFDGTSPPSMTAVGISVRLTPAREGENESRFASAAADGTFMISGVMPGDYVLSASIIPRAGSSAGWIFKSASAGNRDITDATMTIAAGQSVEPAVVSFTDQLTEITGLLQGANGQPSSEYFIVVFPAHRALWSAGSRRMQVVRPTTDGRYMIKGLPAGDYALAAIEDVKPDDLLDRAFLEQLLANSPVHVSLKHGAKVTQNIRLGTRIRQSP